MANIVKKTQSTKINNANIVSQEDQSRQKVLSEANDDFRAMYADIHKELVAEEISIFKRRYKIGQMVEEMQKEETKYGSNSVARMEQAIGMGKQVIIQSLVFAQRFTEEEVLELEDLRNKAGDPLLWTHIAHLIRIPDKSVREEHMQLILEKNLTPTELLAYIQSQKVKKSPQTAAGKPLKRPASINGFINQQVTALDQLIKRKTKVWAGSEKPGEKSFIDLLNETPIEKIDAPVLTALQQLEERYQKTSLEMESMASELTRTRKLLEKMKKERALLEEAEAADKAEEQARLDAEVDKEDEVEKEQEQEQEEQPEPEPEPEEPKVQPKRFVERKPQGASKPMIKPVKLGKATPAL